MPRMTALLIGNAAYGQMPPLKNPGNDARDLEQALSARGFATTCCADLSIEDMDRAFNEFAGRVEPGDVVLFFFAGHAVQIDGRNYLMATDTPAADASSAKFRSLSLDEVIEKLRGANAATTLIILDACRDNPWAGHRGGSGGFAPVYAPKGTLLAFSTSPGEVARDGTGKNGAYTAALLQHIGTPDLPIEQMFKRVRNTLAVTTNGTQTSWEHTSLAGEFYFDLGVTRQITEYGAVALKDNIFVPNSEIWAHNLIRGLKEYSWSPQNTALGNFSAEQAKTTELDDLFLLGRNILQAAEGRSFRAQDFIEHFMQHTADLPSERRKGILDGILFEMFFDANGTFRSTRKLRCFNQAFALQKFEDLAASFDFLSAALAPHQQHFHVVPGRGRPAAIDIRLQDDPQDSVADISFGGGSILRPDGRHEGEDPEYRRYARAAFEELLSHQLMIPQHDLTIAYSVAIPEAIRFPYGHTVER